MTIQIFTDRSRVESYQRCARLRFLEYHQDGTGITSAQKALPLAVGGAVHRGLEVLLRVGQEYWDKLKRNDGGSEFGFSQYLEDQAVDAALADLSQYRGSMALDTSEALAQASAQPDSVVGLADQLQQMAEQLGVAIDDPVLQALHDTPRVNGKAGFDDYLWKEQSGLVEGIVRSYSRRRLRPLLEEFEVLEVEREGTWELASWGKKQEIEYVCPKCGHTYQSDNYAVGGGPAYCPKDNAAYVQHIYDTPESGNEIVFCSRPDALLRSRADNSLYLMSFKTAAAWDRRKELDAQHDMQGLSEGVEVERRLTDWWQQVQAVKALGVDGDLAKTDDIPKATWDYLAALPAPPRILGIRYEYILKGYRGEDKDLSARFGFKCWSQRSHLVRRYRAVSQPKKGEAGFLLGDLCWSFDYLKDDGSESKLYYGHWKSEPVFEHASAAPTMKAWIDRLDDSQEAMSAFDSTVGMEPRAMGWKSSGQALGFTREHPLDAIFVAPITVYRNSDDLYDWIESTEAQEVRVAESVAQIESALDEGERRSLLNRLMPMTRRACEYPSSCAFVKVCYAGEDMKRDPLASGKFVGRMANHQAERDAGAISGA